MTRITKPLIPLFQKNLSFLPIELMQLNGGAFSVHFRSKILGYEEYLF